MNWLKMSLAKAVMYEADGNAGGSPAATLVSDPAAAEAGSTGDAADLGAGGKVEEGAKKTPDYLSSIPKELRDNKAFLEHEDLSSFLKKSLADSDKLASFDLEKVLNIPDDEASDEDREAFYQKLGKPETVEGYELDDPGFPDGLPRDAELEGHIKAMAHKVNMPADMLKQFVGLYNDHVSGLFAAVKEADQKELKENTNALKTELKDGYDEFMIKGQRAAIKLGGEELITLFKDCGIEAHPTIVKAFGNLGGMISDDSALGGSGTGGGGEVKPKGFDGNERLTYEFDKKQE